MHRIIFGVFKGVGSSLPTPFLFLANPPWTVSSDTYLFKTLMSLLGHLKMADGYSKQPEPDAFERSRHTLPFIRPQKSLKIPKQNAALYVSEPTVQHPSLTLAAGLTFS